MGEKGDLSMSSYYSDKDILDMFPLNYDDLDNEEQVRIIQEVALICDVSVDRVLDALR